MGGVTYGYEDGPKTVTFTFDHSDSSKTKGYLDIYPIVMNSHGHNAQIGPINKEGKVPFYQDIEAARKQEKGELRNTIPLEVLNNWISGKIDGLVNEGELFIDVH